MLRVQPPPVISHLVILWRLGLLTHLHQSDPPLHLPETKRSPSQSPSKAPLVAPWHSLFLRHLDRILCSSPGDLCAWGGWEARDGRAAIWGLLVWMGSSFLLSHPPPPPPPLLTACPLGDKEEINTEPLFIPHDPNSNMN